MIDEEGGDMGRMTREVHVLVIDDSASSRSMASQLLRANGFRQIVLVDGAKAAYEELRQRAISGSQFDVILLDRYLKDHSGIDVLAGLKEHRCATPVIMVTSEDNSARVLEAIAGGAADYIVKPYSAETVYAKIQKVLKEPLTDS
jgi:two-component system, chemotaxis family, chemotaxis protein CheY